MLRLILLLCACTLSLCFGVSHSSDGGPSPVPCCLAQQGQTLINFYSRSGGIQFQKLYYDQQLEIMRIDSVGNYTSMEEYHYYVVFPKNTIYEYNEQVNTCTRRYINGMWIPLCVSREYLTFVGFINIGGQNNQEYMLDEQTTVMVSLPSQNSTECLPISLQGVQGDDFYLSIYYNFTAGVNETYLELPVACQSSDIFADEPLPGGVTHVLRLFSMELYNKRK